MNRMTQHPADTLSPLVSVTKSSVMNVLCRRGMWIVLSAIICVSTWGCGAQPESADTSRMADSVAETAAEQAAPMAPTEASAEPADDSAEVVAGPDKTAVDAESAQPLADMREEEESVAESPATSAAPQMAPEMKLAGDQPQIEQRVAPPAAAGGEGGNQIASGGAGGPGIGSNGTGATATGNAGAGGNGTGGTANGNGGLNSRRSRAMSAAEDHPVPSRGAAGGQPGGRPGFGANPVGGMRASGGGFGGGGLGGGGGGLQQLEKLPESTRRKLSVLSELQPGEELWVIAKPPAGPAADQAPGTGSLMARLDGQTETVPCPLKQTDVTGSIAGYIATVQVRQAFENPFDEKIEAVYTFPLPDSAAVSEFVMTVGERKIRGIIREKEKAEQIYAAAKSQGHVASLMTQQRANIFTQKVANIEPGHQIDIEVQYFNTLQYDDGAYEFAFPMVVGPRFNPTGTTDGIGAVPRGQGGQSGQGTDIEYLAPDERSGRDVSVTLTLDAGVTIEDLNSVNHAVDINTDASGRRTIRLSASDNIANKDFVFRYTVAGQQIKTALMTHEDRHGRYFTMMLYPPADLQQIERTPMEMVFVLDCSGSMRGKPIGQAKNAIAHCLQNLTPRDSFQIIRFSNDSSQLGPVPLIATEENIRAGLEYLRSLSGTGGTQMVEGVKAALDFPHDQGRFRIVSFMTDGYIGNENHILQAVNEKLGASRIFSFGVGSSPNRMLMDRMAILGKGAVAYLSLNDDAVAVMDAFNRRISHPAMTDLSIDWGDMDVADVYPKRIPDLIVGRPVIVTGRYRGTPDTVTVSGRAGMQPASFEVAAADATATHAGVSAVWARLKIKDMMNTLRTSPAAAEEIQQSVLQTALNHGLMSNFTAFVAVDSLTRTDGEPGRTVNVPSEVPDGVDYNATVSGSDE